MVYVFGERITFTQSCAGIFDQIKGSQSAKWQQQFFYLLNRKTINIKRF